ncbi:MAG: hypothetical protein GY774_41340 [Planctomycetes bacterium]|nr:hypothetical protein [Planctomycetota bacterium]
MGTTKKKTEKSKPSKTSTAKGSDNKAKIEELLKQLKVTTIQREKKIIRRSLRALGHVGGLRKVKAKA